MRQWLVPVLAAVLVLAGCGSADEADKAGSSESAAAAASSRLTVGAPAFEAKALPAFSLEANTIGKLEPEKWLHYPQIKSIIAGTVDGFEVGPKLNAQEESFASPTLVMKVNVKEVFKGSMPRSGSVYVVVRTRATIEAASKSMPVGTVVGLYLEGPFTDKTGSGIKDLGAGRPDGEDLWGVSPLAFVVANGPNGGVILPQMGSVMRERTFDSMLPVTAGGATAE